MSALADISDAVRFIAALFLLIGGVVVIVWLCWSLVTRDD